MEILDLLGRLAEMIKYFRASGPALCSQFLETLCMECENIPMRLESRLVSVAGTTSVPSKYTKERLSCDKLWAVAWDIYLGLAITLAITQ